MAGPISQSLINELQDELLCAICMESSDLKELPCQHSYCTSCINQMKHYFTKKLTCPECRAIHKLPKEKAHGFPANRLAHRLNEKLERHKEALSNPSGWSESSSHDSLTLVGSSVDKPTEVFAHDRCQLSAHNGPTRSCEVFCKFCKNTMCTRCGLLSRCANHKQHSCVDIQQAFCDAQKSLSDFANVYKKLAEQESSHKRMLQEEVAALQQKIADKRRMIREVEDRVDRYNGEASRVESLGDNQDLLKVIGDTEQISVECRGLAQNVESINSTQSLATRSEYHEIVAPWLLWILAITRDAFIALVNNPRETIVYAFIGLFILFLNQYDSKHD